MLLNIIIIYSNIASVTIETLLISNNFMRTLYEALVTDAILVKTWTLGQYDIYIYNTLALGILYVILPSCPCLNHYNNSYNSRFIWNQILRIVKMFLNEENT